MMPGLTRALLVVVSAGGVQRYRKVFGVLGGEPMRLPRLPSPFTGLPTKPTCWR
jgi:hypothetical protein